MKSQRRTTRAISAPGLLDASLRVWSHATDCDFSSKFDKGDGLKNRPVAITGACEVEELSSLAVRDLEPGEGVGLPRESRLPGISANGRYRPKKSEPPPPVGTVRRRCGTTSCVRPMCEPAGAVSVPSEAAWSVRYSSVCWSSTRARYVTPRSRGSRQRRSSNSSLDSIADRCRPSRSGRTCR